MRPLSLLQPPLPEAWDQVLDNVEATLHKAEAAAAEHGQAISLLCPSLEVQSEQPTNWQVSLERLEELMKGGPTVLEQAAKEAAEADAVLDAGEGALRRWLSAAEMLERRLAKWVEPEV